MNVDIQSLETFNQLAREGAEQATASMTQMTGIEADVEVTKLSLVDRQDIGEELGEHEFVGVQFDYEGELAGDTVLMFDRDCSTSLVEALVGSADSESMARSGVKEIGNIMMSGFIDGWANYLGATIDHSPPTYIEGDGRAVLPDVPVGDNTDHVFVFKSRIEWTDESVEFYIYMLPEYEPLTVLMAEHVDTEDDAIPVDKLEVFNEMTRQGTETAAENVTMMAGIETEAEVSQISFAPITDVPKQISNETYVGTVVEFTGIPSGYLMVLFDELSARNVAEAMMPIEVESEALTDQHESAIKELGNIMTSGFVDGWANVLQAAVDHTPPRLVHDMGQAIIDPLVAQVGRQQEHAFIVESTMRTDDIEFEAEIHALPNEQELREALDELQAERAEQTDADPEEIFQG
ncbi:Chemotaxis protein CheC, inhibitor of MCP methylation [Halapricum desulfuricans]|uniref:Chemotaxis protein CheC, inhibitor of MCP methylation n=1 Tax=Halapricum desulfuricans TaxID=2841257 RepID=A0A897NDW4_9EURY|nr:chemotaxis protein CheC [Halapricum desulfuricans]QSG10862.1 Chemotaxis protein CheC, inhibitor of MCP methylation [Halapricum desulfuricans]